MGHAGPCADDRAPDDDRDAAAERAAASAGHSRAAVAPDGSILEGGGFSGVEVEELELEFEWDSPEEFTRYTQDIVAPLVALVSQHPQEVQQETWAAITEAVRERASADGKVKLPNLVLLASGRA